MLRTIFTLDYEIHGNGDGCPIELMVEPTDRLLRLFDEFGARLTIMADVAEILKFRERALHTGRDDFHFRKIELQLQDAIARGHDVQLHIHSSYFNARFEGGAWQQDWNEYDFARLPFGRMDSMIRQGKEYLETLLRPVAPSYRCEVFRAANWSVSPSANVVRALIGNGIRVDTSVFKYGRRSGKVEFDYSSANSALVPWRVDAEDICKPDDSSLLWEFPIYAEERSVAAFLTLQRFHRAFVGRFHRLREAAPMPAAGRARRPRSALARHAWKADFNQCTGRQLIAAMTRASARFAHTGSPQPFVLIGHSKLFSRLNEWSLRPLLAHVSEHPRRFQFGKFTDFLLPAGDAVPSPAN